MLFRNRIKKQHTNPASGSRDIVFLSTANSKKRHFEKTGFESSTHVFNIRKPLQSSWECPFALFSCSAFLLSSLGVTWWLCAGVEHFFQQIARALGALAGVPQRPRSRPLPCSSRRCTAAPLHAVLFGQQSGMRVVPWASVQLELHHNVSFSRQSFVTQKMRQQMDGGRSVHTRWRRVKTGAGSRNLGNT